MKSWQSTLIGPDVSLREALEIIDSAGTQLAVVVDEHRRLLGTVSDGDARRALLSGLGMDDRVGKVMHARATTVSASSTPQEILETMRRTGLHQLPIVDAENVVVGLALIGDYLSAERRDNWVVIMAGGLGSRLQELTRDVPKPMLKVGSRPLLETIIRSYAEQGFHRFYLAVNYKAEQIETYFGDGSALGVDIRYLREEQRMGTAGALSLLQETPSCPFIVTNADLLTKENFGLLVDQHAEAGGMPRWRCAITRCRSHSASSMCTGDIFIRSRKSRCSGLSSAPAFMYCRQKCWTWFPLTVSSICRHYSTLCLRTA